MRRGNSICSGLDYRLAAGSLLVFFGLALPFIPLPGDQITRIAVEFRTEARAEPRAFTADTSATICTVLAAAMTYDDPASGSFTRIDCGKDATEAPLLQSVSAR